MRKGLSLRGGGAKTATVGSRAPLDEPTAGKLAERALKATAWFEHLDIHGVPGDGYMVLARWTWSTGFCSFVKP